MDIRGKRFVVIGGAGLIGSVGMSGLHEQSGSRSGSDQIPGLDVV